MSTLAAFLLVFFGGWLLRGAVGSAWRAVRRPHRFSDARHKWVSIDGEEHAFTDSELREALFRARRLTPGRGRWLRAAGWTLLIGALLLVAVTGCGKKDIPTSQAMAPLKVWVPTTGKSMLPTFPESALVEAEVGVPFEALKAGDTVIFWDYFRGEGRFTHHRLVEQQLGNWIARGDNPETNPRADRPWVTKDNYVARTTGRHARVITAP